MNNILLTANRITKGLQHKNGKLILIFTQRLASSLPFLWSFFFPSHFRSKAIRSKVLAYTEQSENCYRYRCHLPWSFHLKCSNQNTKSFSEDNVTMAWKYSTSKWTPFVSRDHPLTNHIPSKLHFQVHFRSVCKTLKSIFFFKFFFPVFAAVPFDVCCFLLRPKWNDQRSNNNNNKKNENILFEKWDCASIQTAVAVVLPPLPLLRYIQLAIKTRAKCLLNWKIKNKEQNTSAHNRTASRRRLQCMSRPKSGMNGTHREKDRDRIITRTHCLFVKYWCACLCRHHLNRA